MPPSSSSSSSSVGEKNFAMPLKHSFCVFLSRFSRCGFVGKIWFCASTVLLSQAERAAFVLLLTRLVLSTFVRASAMLPRCDFATLVGFFKYFQARFVPVLLPDFICRAWPVCLSVQTLQPWASSSLRGPSCSCLLATSRSQTSMSPSRIYGRSLLQRCWKGSPCPQSLT